MKTITINVSEPVYRDFKKLARQLDRPTSELIREAMEEYRQHRIQARPSLRDLKPLSLGKILRPLAVGGDLLDEMLNA